MDINKAIEMLTEYVMMDRKARLQGNYSKELDAFMEERCTAIETLIEHVEYIEENKCVKNDV